MSTFPVTRSGNMSILFLMLLMFKCDNIILFTFFALKLFKMLCVGRDCQCLTVFHVLFHQ